MRADWRPYFWEPVEGTGERLMAGVVLFFDGQVVARRLLRDDVLDALYGSGSANPKLLLDKGLDLCLSIARAGGVEALADLSCSVMGLIPGALRRTDALSVADALRQAVLLHSSLSQLDGLDATDDADSPQAEEVNKRFATEVRDAVFKTRPEIFKYFNKSVPLHDGGSQVKFGYFSESTILHFSVLHPVRQANSVSYARARLWELGRAKEHAQVAKAALITAVPRGDDPTLGPKQQKMLIEKKRGIELEADDAGMRFIPVTSVSEATERVLEFAV